MFAADASPARSPRRMQYVRFKIQSGDMAGAHAGDVDLSEAVLLRQRVDEVRGGNAALLMSFQCPCFMPSPRLPRTS